MNNSINGSRSIFGNFGNFGNWFGRNQQNNLDLNQNANQMNNHQQNKNVLEIPMLDLIYNLTRLDNEFLENVETNKYCMFAFLQQIANEPYICYWTGRFEFNLDGKNIVEIGLDDKQINALKLFIKQEDPNCDYMDYLLADENKNNISTSTLEEFKFVCLDGEFENHKLKKLMYVKKDSEKNERLCVVNFDYLLKPNKENLCRLISKIGLSRNAISPKKMIIGGKAVEVTFENGPLLNSGESICFDPLCIAVNLQRSGSNVAFNFNSKDVMYFLFIKSDYFGDGNWHFDDRGNGNFYESSSYMSKHNETGILTYGLKVFISSGNLKGFDDMYGCNYEKLRDDQKMEFLRENGFCELELHEIKYCDPSKNVVSQSRKVFLTPDFFDRENIDRSLVYDFTKMERINKPAIFYGEEYTYKERDQKWKELKRNSAIVQSNIEMVNVSRLAIDKKSLFDFLRCNLNCCNSEDRIRFVAKSDDFDLDGYTSNLVINGKNDVHKEEIFETACNDTKITEIILEHSENIYQLSLTVANNVSLIKYEIYAFGRQTNKEKTTSVELVLKRDENGKPAFFYKNKKTNIKVRSHKTPEMLIKMNENGNFELWQGNKKLDINLTIDNKIQNLIPQNNKIPLKDKISDLQNQNSQLSGYIPNQSSINLRDNGNRNFYK